MILSDKYSEKNCSKVKIYLFHHFLKKNSYYANFTYKCTNGQGEA